jgi:hypothetical protein
MQRLRHVDPRGPPSLKYEQQVAGARRPRVDYDLPDRDPVLLLCGARWMGAHANQTNCLAACRTPSLCVRNGRVQTRRPLRPEQPTTEPSPHSSLAGVDAGCAARGGAGESLTPVNGVSCSLCVRWGSVRPRQNPGRVRNRHAPCSTAWRPNGQFSNGPTSALAPRLAGGARRFRSVSRGQSTCPSRQAARVSVRLSQRLGRRGALRHSEALIVSAILACHWNRSPHRLVAPRDTGLQSCPYRLRVRA